MTLVSFIQQSLRHYWRGHAGLLFGAFLASAILSGSLVIGDSVRASLRRVAELRLGKIGVGLLGGDRWLTDKLARDAELAPVIIMQGSASARGGSARANGVQVLGVDEAFWRLSPSGRAIAIGGNEMAINEPLARKLGVAVGDTLVVNIERPSAISRDAPLSGATNEQEAMRLKVAAIVPPEDFGAFQLAVSQRQPDTVFVPLAYLQSRAGKEGRVNAMLGAAVPNPAALEKRLDEAAGPDDFALKLTQVRGRQTEWEVSTDRVFLDEAISRKLLGRAAAYGVLTYLVNNIESASGKTPYSMVTAVDRMASTTARTPAAETRSRIVITQWLADDRKLAVGDSVTLRYYVVGIGRELQEKSAEFTVGGILPMDNPEVNATWTPQFPGISDVDNCRDWEPGIPMDLKTIRDEDEKYWDDYKGTPKGFISLAAGQELWKNRFGSMTAVRIPAGGLNENWLRSEIGTQVKLADIGLGVRDFAGEAGAAAKGSVDFGGLFVGLSMFLIAAALIFAALLYLFMLERRAGQVGLLLAMGWTRAKVRNVILGESGCVALAGTVLGLIGGVAYTRAALAGLGGVWSGAAQGLPLVYHAGLGTLIIALVAALGISVLTLWLASRHLFRIPARSLLAGDAEMPRAQKALKDGWLGRVSGWLRWNYVSIGSLVLAIVLALMASRARDAEALAGMFFGAGALLMISGLAAALGWMRSRSFERIQAHSLWQIGARNVSRRPSRSLAVLGMMAGGIFLVVAVNAFRMGVESDPTRRDSGTGGFALIGESSLPIYEDLNKQAGWDAYGLDAAGMKDVAVAPFRVRQGDDASCLNLNRAQNPTLVAVNPALLAQRKAFKFAGDGNWEMLSQEQADGAIPAIADQNTAMWGLGKGVGDTLTYDTAGGEPLTVKIVALLAGSVLQGKMIISESAFLRRFPDAAGYRFLLIDAPSARMDEVKQLLTRQVEARGLALEPAADRMAEFNSVQNTYIGIFTVLGGLGVLLGTAGLGVLVARHVLERKGELGLMQALGFSQGALRAMVMGEHATLLLGGVLLGVICAAIAVWPNLTQSSGGLPLGFLWTLIIGILLFGAAVCWLAVANAVRGRLIEAIRRE